MDYNVVVQAITSVGFPIVMCLLMYKYVTEDSKQTRETIHSLEEAIKAIESGIDILIKISSDRLDRLNKEDRSNDERGI